MIFPPSGCGSYFGMPTRVLSGPGSISMLGEELAARGLERAVVFTGVHLVDGDFFRRACEKLWAAGVSVVVEPIAQADPTVELMDAAADLVARHERTAVIGIGGGSSLDLAKAAAIGAALRESVRSVVGEHRVPVRSNFVVAVPTTVGTGSEVSWHISVRDTVAQKKVTIRSVNVCPDLAILDAHAIGSVPPDVAGMTAADSFTHLYESFVSNKGSWVLTDGLALAGMRALVENVGPFLADRGDEAAGQNVLDAAMLGGIVLSHARTGVVHQMSRPLGALYHVPHGVANAIVLPRVARFLVDRIPEKMGRTYEAFSALDDVGLALQSDVLARAERVSELVARFMTSLGVADHLAACGVEDPDLAKLAHDALQGQPQVENPCTISEEEVVQLYRECCS